MRSKSKYIRTASSFLMILFGISFLWSLSVQGAPSTNPPGVTGGPFGSSTTVGQFSVKDGKITAATSVPIEFPNTLSTLNILDLLDVSGHMDASGDKPSEAENHVLCPHGDDIEGSGSRPGDGSNSVRGQILMGANDVQCTFHWAPGTEYESNPYCVVSNAGAEHFAPSAFAGQIALFVNKPVTAGPVAINYICMGR